MFSFVRDRETGKPISAARRQPPPQTLCDETGDCEMRNLCNPLTRELNLRNVYVCARCHRTHLCDLRHDCVVVNTQEGSVCVRTGLSYGTVFPNCRVDALEPVMEPNTDEVNIVGIIMSYIYTYLTQNAEHYADVITAVVEDGWFKKGIESAIYFTFNRVFKQTNNLHRIPLDVVGQLFVQLVIGVHARATKYDSTVIKVSRRKREDGLLKRMRFEYGNAPAFGYRG